MEQNYEVGELVIKVIFSSIQKPKELVRSKDLNAEQALFARVYCEELVRLGRNDVEDLLPELKTYSEIIREVMDDEQDEEGLFIALQLVLLAKYRDFSDEVGRQCLLTLLRELLCSLYTPADFVKPLIDCLQNAQSSHSDFLTYLSISLWSKDENSSRQQFY